MVLELDGRRFPLDTAAVSAIRYRAAYGDSVVNHLADCASWKKAEGILLRMCHLMIPSDQRPPLLELAALARRDGGMLAQGLQARDALLAPDPRAPVGGEPDGNPFDEYGVLALMAAAGVDTRLIYELPVLHLAGVAGRCFALKNPDRKTYRPMSQEDRSMLYPRPKRRKE